MISKTGFRGLTALLTSVLILSGSSRAGSQSPAVSASAFVQKFYDWYLPTGVPFNQKPGWRTVLATKSSLLSASLQKGLAREARSDEINNLDADPFVNSQDPCERYEVGKVSRRGVIFRVEVYAVCKGKREATASVVAELVRKKSNWIFVNFQYPDGSDLLTVLSR